MRFLLLPTFFPNFLSKSVEPGLEKAAHAFLAQIVKSQVLDRRSRASPAPRQPRPWHARTGSAASGGVP